MRLSRSARLSRSVQFFRRRGPALQLLAAALLLACIGALFPPGQAMAQSVQTLVKNTSQTSYLIANSTEQAQGFTTGRNSTGYGLTSVGISFGAGSSSTDPVVKIYTTDSDGEPDSEFVTLTNPASLRELALNTFTAPADTTLSANTTYAVVIDPNERNLNVTDSHNEDSGKAAGWSIANQRYRRNNPTDSWSSATELLLRIEIKGTIKANPNNNAATGAPAITGVPQVGRTLTAGIGTIADADGLPTTTFPTGYAFQWIRVAGANETNISGATSRTYAPVAADVGKTIKVKVSFTDDDGNGESLTSAATARRGRRAVVLRHPRRRRLVRHHDGGVRRYRHYWKLRIRRPHRWNARSGDVLLWECELHRHEAGAKFYQRRTQ